MYFHHDILLEYNLSRLKQDYKLIFNVDLIKSCYTTENIMEQLRVDSKKEEFSMPTKKNVGMIGLIMLLILSGCTNSDTQSDKNDLMTANVAESETDENIFSQKNDEHSEEVADSEFESTKESRIQETQSQTVPIPSETTPKNIINSQNVIGESRALEIAFARARVSGNAATVKDVELDRENNRLEYEIKFESGNMEYEVSIDAYTGEVIEFSQEEDD